MSLAIVSASGPTTTWTTLPAAITPCAPAALSAAWSTLEASRTSVRSRVMHGSISMMLFAPPSPAMIASHQAAIGPVYRHGNYDQAKRLW